MTEMNTRTKFVRGGGRGWEACEAWFLEIYSIVLNRFLRAPVGIRGFLGGERGGGV